MRLARIRDRDKAVTPGPQSVFQETLCPDELMIHRSIMLDHQSMVPKILDSVVTGNVFFKRMDAGDSQKLQ